MPTWRASPAAGRCSSYPTACLRSWTATRSWSWNAGSWWISDHTRPCWNGARSTAPSGTSRIATCIEKDLVMQLSPRPSSKALEPRLNDRLDPTLPVILEYQSPSSAVINMPMPRFARGVSWTIFSLVVSLFTVSGIVQVDRVVTAPGVVVSKASTIVVQPLETAIVRSIDVDVGQEVHAGQVLARLDPTFAT